MSIFRSPLAPSALVTLAFTGTALVGSSLFGVGCARRARVETTTAVVQASTEYYQPAPTNILIAEPQAPEIVRAAVIRALADLNYTIAGEDGQRIVATYRRGRENVQIQVEYWPTQATVTYVSSTGLRFRRDGSSPSYDRWMTNLQRTIPSHVAALARRAQPVIVVQQPAPTTGTIVVQPAPPPPTTGGVIIQEAPPSATVQGTFTVTTR